MELEKLVDVFIFHRDMVGLMFDEDLSDVMFLSIGLLKQVLIDMIPDSFPGWKKNLMVEQAAIYARLANAVAQDKKIYINFDRMSKSADRDVERILVHELFHCLGFKLNPDLLSLSSDPSLKLRKFIMNEGCAMYGALNYPAYFTRFGFMPEDRFDLVNVIYDDQLSYQVGFLYFHEMVKGHEDWKERFVEVVRRVPTEDEILEACADTGCCLRFKTVETKFVIRRVLEAEGPCVFRTD